LPADRVAIEEFLDTVFGPSDGHGRHDSRAAAMIAVPLLRNARATIGVMAPAVSPVQVLLNELSGQHVDAWHLPSDGGSGVIELGYSSFASGAATVVRSRPIEGAPARVEIPCVAGRYSALVVMGVLERLVQSPAALLTEARRVLEPDGSLLLIVPNVARLEQVARLVLGENVWPPLDERQPGCYREYTLPELRALLAAEGFRHEASFTADVAENDVRLEERVRSLLRFREHELGQVAFCLGRRGDGAAAPPPDVS
jgi:hypothetical protein